MGKSNAARRRDKRKCAKSAKRAGAEPTPAPSKSVKRERQSAEVVTTAEEPVESELRAVFEAFSERPATKEQSVVDRQAPVVSDVAKEPSERAKRRRERPKLAFLKQLAPRPDLVEQHDVSAPDPFFLVKVKAVPGVVGVPAHWVKPGKYLQSKRLGEVGSHFRLPDFISKTGVSKVRDVLVDEQADSLRRQMREQARGKLSSMEMDYQELYDAFFKHQKIQPNLLSQLGEVYVDSSENFGANGRNKLDVYVPGSLSSELRVALGMHPTKSSVPPPWLRRMQRYGPPPGYPHLPVPGVNAPIPSGAKFGERDNEWGVAPKDALGHGAFGDVVPEDFDAGGELWGALVRDDVVLNDDDDEPPPLPPLPEPMSVSEFMESDEPPPMPPLPEPQEEKALFTVVQTREDGKYDIAPSAPEEEAAPKTKRERKEEKTEQDAAAKANEEKVEKKKRKRTRDLDKAF